MLTATKFYVHKNITPDIWGRVKKTNGNQTPFSSGRRSNQQHVWPSLRSCAHLPSPNILLPVPEPVKVLVVLWHQSVRLTTDTPYPPPPVQNGLSKPPNIKDLLPCPTRTLRLDTKHPNTTPTYVRVDTVRHLPKHGPPCPVASTVPEITSHSLTNTQRRRHALIKWDRENLVWRHILGGWAWAHGAPFTQESNPGSREAEVETQRWLWGRFSPAD